MWDMIYEEVYFKSENDKFLRSGKKQIVRSK